MSADKLQKAIMRRVYYAYAVSLVSRSVFWQGVFLGAALLLLADWLHVFSIINNFLSVPVGQVHYYILTSFVGAITAGKFLTVATAVAVVLVSVSVSFHLASLFVRLQFFSRSNLEGLHVRP